MLFHVEHKPEGFACNMGYVVCDADGAERYRGPQWAANYRAQAWNAGRLTSEEQRDRERARALVEATQTLLRVVSDARRTRTAAPMCGTQMSLQVPA